MKDAPVKTIIHPLTISSGHYSSFYEIIQTGAVDYCDKKEIKVEDFSEKLFSRPQNWQPRKLALYYEARKNNCVRHEDLQKYLRGIGYKIIADPHPSLLINAMKELSKKILSEECQLPWFTSIILLGKKRDYINNKFLFAIDRRSNGLRTLKLHKINNSHAPINEDCAVLIEKIKN